jgi:aerobic carbon-monoxide dehydrogenase medium subunit
VTLPPFQLHRPNSVEEASHLLMEHGDDAALYCGGSELVLLMKLGFADYGHLIDIKGIEELRTLREDDGVLRIGAATTHRQLERSPIVRGGWPALAQMERNVANIRVRTVGSLGGNLCFADPHSDPATFLLTADAELTFQRGTSKRVGAFDAFLRGPYEVALDQGEILTAIHLPKLPAGAAMAHVKLSFHERPAATVSCMVRVDNGSIAEARVAVGSVGVVPVRVRQVEGVLAGLSAEGSDTATVEDAAMAAAEASGAVADGNGSAEYKRNLVRVLVGRCFNQALAEANP